MVDHSLVTFFNLPIVYSQIKWLTPIHNPKAKIKFLCQLPYQDHPKGCPSLGTKFCPPNSFDYYLKIQSQLQTFPNLLLFIAKFDFKTHQTRLQIKHPTWSDRQLQCCLYYQNWVKKDFFLYIFEHCDVRNDLILGCGSGFGNCFSMEGIGINVFGTLKNLRIPFEVKPKTVINFVSLVASNHIPIHQTNMDLFMFAITKQPNKEYIKTE